MNSVINIIELFSGHYNQINDKCSEDFYTLSLLYNVNSLRNLIPEKTIGSIIPKRDVLTINIFDSADENDEIAANYNSSKNNWDEFREEYANIDKDVDRIVKIEISKTVGENIHSVYSYELFCKFLQNSNPFSILGQLQIFLATNTGIYSFEWQEDNISSFSTSRFYFIGRGKRIISDVKVQSEQERRRCVDKARFLCSSNGFKGELTPDDLFPVVSQENSILKQFFCNISALYSACFLLDNTFVDNDVLQYKLNGFKSISGTWSLSQDIEDCTYKIIQNIYQWGYLGGNIDDKIMIIRNILSLNLDPQTLIIHTNTLDAIISNYKIYQKENVRQYLDLRNNVVNDIHNYQDSILHAIDNFEDTFKKISITLLSFIFITVILTILSFSLSSIRFIPDAVIFCCLALSIISLVYYLQEKKWLKERIEHLRVRFKKSKKYYEDLLGEDELKNFFENENDEKNDDVIFRNKKIKDFSNLWFYSTLIIIVVLIIALIVNHIHPLQEIIQLLHKILSNLTQTPPDAPIG